MISLGLAIGAAITAATGGAIAWGALRRKGGQPKLEATWWTKPRLAFDPNVSAKVRASFVEAWMAWAEIGAPVGWTHDGKVRVERVHRRRDPRPGEIYIQQDNTLGDRWADKAEWWTSEASKTMRACRVRVAGTVTPLQAKHILGHSFCFDLKNRHLAAPGTWLANGEDLGDSCEGLEKKLKDRYKTT